MKYLLLISLTVFLFFLPFSGHIPLFDWDEANFAEISREMIERGNFIQITVNYEPFHEKPPLYFWIQALSMKVFGVNETAARLPNIFLAVLTLLFLFFTGKKLKGVNFGLLWVLCFGGAFLPQFYFRFAIIDPLFNLLLFAALVFCFLAITEPQMKTFYLLMSGLTAGLSVLAKGPAGLFLVFLSLLIFFIINRKLYSINPLKIFLWGLALILPWSVWMLFLQDYPHFHSDFIRRNFELISHQDAGHGGFIFYHFFAVFLGMFPMSVFAIYQIAYKKNCYFSFSSLMIIVLLTVLVVFTLVRTKIIHYSSLAYFPVSWLAAESFSGFSEKQVRIPVWLKTIAILSAGLFSIVFASFPVLMKYREYFMSFISDEFVRACLSADSIWSLWHILIAMFLAALFMFTTIKMLNQPAKRNLFYSNLLILLLTSEFFWISILPQIQKHTQGALVDFCLARAEKNAYYLPFGFKSYLPYFYGKVKPDNDFAGKNHHEILLTPKVKNLYIIMKAGKSEKFIEMYNLKELYRKNGWVFLVRKFDQISE